MPPKQIYFGEISSQEHLLSTEEGRGTGIEFSQLNDASKTTAAVLSEFATVKTFEQEQLLRDLEVKKRARQIAVPTIDEVVRKYLRILGEPITLFGEGPYDRRERLGIFMSQNVNSPQLSRLWSMLEADRIKEREAAKRQVEDSEEFYVPASIPDLLEIRRWFVDFSLQRAHERLTREREFIETIPVEQIRERRMMRLESTKKIENVSSQIGAERPLSCCTTSFDGKTVAIGAWDGSLKLWSVPECEPIEPINSAIAQNGHDVRVSCVQFNPLPSSLGLASSALDGSIKLWRLEANNQGLLGELRGHVDRVARIKFHPSGKFLASASFDYSWRLWDLDGQREIQLQEGHSRPVYSIDCHPDGSLVATGGLDAICRVWDIRCGKAIWTIQGKHCKPILALSFAPAHSLNSQLSLATGGEDGQVHLWDLRMLKALRSLAAHSSVVSGLVFSADGEMLGTCSYDKTIKLWSTFDGRLIKSLTGHEGKVMDLDIFYSAGNSDQDATILSASYDRTFKLWK